MINNQRKGFTFVELLIVVTIFSLLSVAVYGTFASGMRLWKRIQDASLLQRKVLLAIERIAQDLHQVIDFSKIGFTGTPGQVSFPILFQEDIIRVTYFLEDRSLYRKEENFKDILEEKEQAQIKKRLSDIQDLKFSFGYKEEGKDEYTFKDTWNKEEGVPVIIKLELKVNNANFIKTVTIPTA